MEDFRSRKNSRSRHHITTPNEHQHYVSSKASRNSTYQRTEQTQRTKYDFNKATEIIASRIVSKQLELGQKPVSASKKSVNFLNKPQIAVRLNNIMIQRILQVHTQDDKDKVKRAVDTVFSRIDIQNTDSSTPTRTASFLSLTSKVSGASEIRDFQTRTSKPIIKPSRITSRTSTTSEFKGTGKKQLTLPRFQLSSNFARTRMTMENKSTQSTLGKEQLNSAVQTNFDQFVTISSVQASPERNLAGKKLQTRLYKITDNETDPITNNSPTKTTNTPVYYYAPYVDRKTQFFDYMSESDLYCLEWFNKYLLPIDLSPCSVIIDKKIRDISEIGTKSTLFTESKTLLTYQCHVHDACCELGQ